MKLASALEGLLKKLFESPSQANPDTFRTIANAVDLLGDLCVAGLPTDLSTNPPVRMLVVDDDLLARRAMTTALQMAFEQPDSANDGASALALAAQESYEVIFLDVQMPDMDGFTLCSKIRQTIPNSTTPVVFVTSQADADARTRALECGGSDLLAKPFLLIELTVKALTFALRGRLQQLKAARN